MDSLNAYSNSDVQWIMTQKNPKPNNQPAKKPKFSKISIKAIPKS